MNVSPGSLARLLILLATACGENGGASAEQGRVQVVLFTHIEDNTPGGMLGTTESRAAYDRLRAKLIETAQAFRVHGLPWVLQPDWKILEAAPRYEDTATMTSTGGKNFLRYLKEDLGVTIDAHSHESGGYNYTDVAYLLDRLGVGGTTVIGGHIWDPALAQFSEWDRFRAPVTGLKFPAASWRGDILTGAGTPNHVNDPVVSGVWRPQDRDHYFVDDPSGNIVSVGPWHDDVAGVNELVQLYASGTVAPDALLTAAWNINPSAITAADGVATIERDVLVPIASLRDQGLVVASDFTALIDTWRTEYGERATVYRP